ncbi:MAG: restriction endonuclease subunit S [Gammaproteobacteria bacterium]|nr:restriction endonuclease subunit S [Gammaproteobacteria bacterium]
MARNVQVRDIPKGWSYQKLDNLAVRCSGHTPSKSYPEYWNGGIKWVSLSDSSVLDQGYIYNTDKEISIEGIKKSSAVVHPAETVFISRDAGIGKSGVMAEPMAVSQHFIAWRCDNKEKLNSWFLYNWLQINKPEFERQAVGSTIKTIGLPYFKKLMILAPTYPEQRKIALILSTWDKAISTTEALIDNSKQQKKALMQQLLTGEKRLLSDSGERFEGEWEDIKLDQLFKFTTAPSKSKNIETVGENYIIDMGSVSREGRLIPSKRTSLSIDFMTIGQLVMPKDDIGGGQIIGRTGYIPENNKYILSDHVYCLTPLKGDSLFLSYLINSNDVNKQLRRKANGTAQLGLGKKDVEKQIVKVPTDIKEQQKIAAALTNADKEIEAALV